MQSSVTKQAVSIVLGVVGVIAILIMMWIGLKAMHRYQVRADKSQARQQALYDHKNQVQINDIKIAQTEQLVKVERQKAQIRVAEAMGIRDSQHIINKTLTPLYLQHEAIMAQMEMAKSKNHTLMWIPSSSNGVPMVDPVREANR